MSILFSPFVETYRLALQPVAPFTWFGLTISTLDLAAAFRLCLALRQMREALHAQHVNGKNDKTKGKAVDEKSLVKDLATTLLVVYGGEAVTAPYLGIPPSFMVSGVVPALYGVIQTIVEYLPAIPGSSFELELPLALLDGFSRAFLLCSFIPPTVVANSSAVLSTSPWTLLITSLITANAGFFFTNFFSFLHPTPLFVDTPPELRPGGWTTTDLWCAPLVTGLYATLTHAQPFWAEAHSIVAGLLGEVEPVKPIDAEVARAACAMLLAGMFVTRTVKNFGGWKMIKGGEVGVRPDGSPKEKTQ
ncbi:hypothetical protein JAAARDRAFT_33239 [Jaapia argillacea MUCL 33604]|uniref:Uncharacterized protein n=1 Tax=Jaapia argillacea MUCL 33604 TaxID=933084 RepID=A0A067PY82_9AGAM|nr:hypothetical protein JAAARDRAFT_33239 [Jaapia argillacea MUCL 33604]